MRNGHTATNNVHSPTDAARRRVGEAASDAPETVRASAATASAPCRELRRAPNAATVGTKANATSIEASSENEIVNAWSRINWPARPCTKTSGKKTTTVVSVEATTAIATVPAPRAAAVFKSSGCSCRLRQIDSNTTIESSTIMPTPIAKPPSDMRFNDNPRRYMMMNVASTLTGIDSEMIAVERRSRRKPKITRIDRMLPMSAASTTSLIARSMNSDWSATVTIVMPSGSASLATRALTARATATVLASPSL